MFDTIAQVNVGFDATHLVPVDVDQQHGGDIYDGANNYSSD